MEIEFTHAPSRPNGWHLIDADCRRTETSETFAMNVGGGVMVKQVERVLDGAWPLGVSTSLAFVPGATVAKRWTVTEVEAHFDEEEGVEVEAHLHLQPEIMIIKHTPLMAGYHLGRERCEMWWEADGFPAAADIRKLMKPAAT